MKLTDNEALQLIKDNNSLSNELILIREQSKTLYALIEGDDFSSELISRIEHLESDKKALARKKYSRDIQDFFERLFQPLENISYATGGNKVYDIDDNEVKAEFLKTIANIKDSNTLAHWIQDVGLKVRHVDPNGIMFMEYTTEPRKEVFPTYKNINTIRKYKKRGQLMEWIIFEPYMGKINGDNYEHWRIVDDSKDRTFIRIGEMYTLSNSLTFTHPFGEVPAIINSNIVKTGYNYTVSPINSILGLSKEYSRDQSIKTLYKFTQGFPIHWRYVTECSDCKGRGKVDNSKGGYSDCGSCDGKGYLTKGDITDIVTLPVPKEGQATIAPNIAGHIKPDNETWNQYVDELNDAEKKAFRTFWGTLLATEETFGGRKTATEVIFNKQPIENKLNQYADYSEFIEWKMSEWILNFVDNGKDKKENKIVITYGRNYVIEPSDTILKRYEESKSSQENDVVLDELFKQYLQSTYRTNPVELFNNIKKSEIEPYLHQTLNDVHLIFGQEEAQRKVLFGKWWGYLTRADILKDNKVLESDFNSWFDDNKIVLIQEETNK